jgi:hypothetical protein
MNTALDPFTWFVPRFGIAWRVLPLAKVSHRDRTSFWPADAFRRPALSPEDRGDNELASQISPADAYREREPLTVTEVLRFSRGKAGKLRYDEPRGRCLPVSGKEHRPDALTHRSKRRPGCF